MSFRGFALAAALLMVVSVIGMGTGGFVGIAQAATLVVDDDGRQCPDARHTTISSAIASASSGDTIQVCSGTYNESVDINVENLRLIANGSAVLDANATKGVAFRVVADDVWIEGFEMRNYTSHVIRVPNRGPFSGYHGTTITNNVIWISGPGAHKSTAGIVFRDRKSNDITITNNFILDAPGGPRTTGDGVDVRSTGSCSTCNRNAVIENNTITARNQGIKLGGGAPGSVVRNNTVTVHQDSSGGDWGIRLEFVRFVEVSGNDITVLDSNIDGIVGSVEKAGGLTIENNAIHGGKHGVRVHVSGSQTTSNPNRPIVIRSNEISNTADDGIRVIDVDGTQVVDNAVTDPGDKGIVLANADDLNATDNRVTGARNGIRLQDSLGSVIDDNRLDGNGIGLNIRPGTDLAAARANIVKNGGIGIRVDGVADSRLRDNIVTSTSSEAVLWVGSTPNTTVRDLRLDSATVSFSAQNVRLDAVDSPPADPADQQNVSAYLGATAIDDSPTPWIDLSVAYADADAQDVNESTLVLWEFDGSAWDEVPGSSVDIAANQVSANLTQFVGVVAPLGELNDTGSDPVPMINASPTSLDFGNVTVGESETDRVTIKNNGTADLNLTAVSLSGSDPGAYSITSGAAPTVIAPGDAHSFVIEFAPGSTGRFAASLDVESNDTDTPVLAVPLSGTGTEPANDSPTLGNEITSCGEINESGSYTLAADISVETGPVFGNCLVITASDVVFDGHGHTIEQSNASREGTGIVVWWMSSLTNVTVTNVTLTGWESGISVIDSNATISGNVIQDAHNGVHIFDGATATVEDNDINHTETGIRVADSTSTVQRNAIDHSRRNGVAMTASTGDVTENTITDTGTPMSFGEGILLAESTGDVTNNTITAADQGIFWILSNGSVTGNVIEDVRNGVHIQGGATANVESNTIKLAGNGIRVVASNATIEDNVINQTFTGVRMRPSASGKVSNNIVILKSLY